MNRAYRNRVVQPSKTSIQLVLVENDEYPAARARVAAGARPTARPEISNAASGDGNRSTARLLQEDSIDVDILSLVNRRRSGARLSMRHPDWLDARCVTGCL